MVVSNDTRIGTSGPPLLTEHRGTEAMSKVPRDYSWERTRDYFAKEPPTVKEQRNGMARKSKRVVAVADQEAAEAAFEAGWQRGRAAMENERNGDRDVVNG